MGVPHLLPVKDNTDLLLILLKTPAVQNLATSSIVFTSYWTSASMGPIVKCALFLLQAVRKSEQSLCSLPKLHWHIMLPFPHFQTETYFRVLLLAAATPNVVSAYGTISTCHTLHL